MIDVIKQWLVTLIVAAFIVNIVDMILPASKLKPYINLALNFIFVFIVISPVINLFNKNIKFEDQALKYFNEYNKDYIDSVNNLSQKTGNQSLASGYEDNLKTIVALKLSEYGYEIENIELDGTNIKKLNLKEKNSNKDKDESIESNNNTKQVFKDKDSTNTGSIREDLNKILNIEIETIEID